MPVPSKANPARFSAALYDKIADSNPNVTIQINFISPLSGGGGGGFSERLRKDFVVFPNEREPISIATV